MSAVAGTLIAEDIVAAAEWSITEAIVVADAPSTAADVASVEII